MLVHAAKLKKSEEGLDSFDISSAAGESKWDMSGRPICRLCGRGVEDLSLHLVEDHGTPLAEYKEQFPNAPVESRSDVGSAESLSFKAREKRQYSVHDTFGFFWSKKKDKQVQGYATPGPLTPKVDPSYVFHPETTQVCLLGLHLKDKVLMHGPTGCGKTTIWEQIAARLNYNFVRINFDSGVTRADLVGQFVVKGKSMDFQYGVLPTAMTLPGTIILFDEWDTVSEECSFVLQRPLEGNSQLLVMEKGNEVITLHPENAIVATANTCGLGDDTGLYSGTRVQNYSQINRFSLTVEASYLPAEEEEKILNNLYGLAVLGEDGLYPQEVAAMVQCANGVREAHLRGDLSVPLSTRDLVNWGQKYVIWGDVQKAARYCFINRLPLEDRDVVTDVIKRAFK